MNPNKSPKDLAAVALAYSPEQDGSPRIVAKGRAYLAEALIEAAHQAGVFVHQDPALVALLMQVDVAQKIPPKLYVAVAEVLSWLWQLDQEQAQAEANSGATL